VAASEGWGGHGGGCVWMAATPRVAACTVEDAGRGFPTVQSQGPKEGTLNREG